METKLFDVFIDVARTHSFADTARAYNLDPSSVSRSIKQLESELGCRLFQRTTRRLSLTQAGQQFLDRIEPIVGELQATTESVQSEVEQIRGKLSIAASVAFGQLCILPFVDSFLSDYPDIQLDLKFSDRNIDLVTEQVDFAIRLAPAIESNVVRSRLMATHYVLCATPEYIKNNQRLDTPESLAQHKVITFDLPDFRRQWLFKKEQEITEVAVSPKLTCSNALVVRDAIMTHIGPGLLPHWIVKKRVEQGELVSLFPSYHITATSFDTAAWIIYPNRHFLPRKTRIAIDYFRDNIRHTFEH